MLYFEKLIGTESISDEQDVYMVGICGGTLRMVSSVDYRSGTSRVVGRRRDNWNAAPSQLQW
jgi:hypothetical protein